MRCDRLLPAMCVLLLMPTSCSNDSQANCDDLRERLAALESSPVISNPSFDNVEDGVDKSIERDRLRAALGHGHHAEFVVGRRG